MECALVAVAEFLCNAIALFLLFSFFDSRGFFDSTVNSKVVETLYTLLSSYHVSSSVETNRTNHHWMLSATDEHLGKMYYRRTKQNFYMGLDTFQRTHIQIERISKFPLLNGSISHSVEIEDEITRRSFQMDVLHGNSSMSKVVVKKRHPFYSLQSKLKHNHREEVNHRKESEDSEQKEFHCLLGSIQKVGQITTISSRRCGKFSQSIRLT